jgi:hypothetical protein
MGNYRIEVTPLKMMVKLVFKTVLRKINQFRMMQIQFCVMASSRLRMVLATSA